MTSRMCEFKQEQLELEDVRVRCFRFFGFSPRRPQFAICPLVSVEPTPYSDSDLRCDLDLTRPFNSHIRFLLLDNDKHTDKHRTQSNIPADGK